MVINHKGTFAVDSREVTEMIAKEHAMLQAPINPADYFIDSTYKTSQNKTQPCYLVTKIGCD